ncbi:carboxymuconolactone decarboxylase family protein [Methanosalsum natronophilum]|uniref:Carboxymuconolactone decarboxylase family protein n=1 Tax=Methanosalsum natronophilum TaxID=768733 RepID=A0A3R7XHX6_9EURY|nr:carboxymuconolactone decarboxylase family protein [Methanosalsum natronophilum]MCS3924876.1 alkylhydroperoxidase/carboxymuconolactone decarboxylase family protein YurZ [Methanosalsum natronophilum]RQD85178.1 MAG: carboxymuconolactone decarboxylase family protein [Methanosalsum natronophilum]
MTENSLKIIENNDEVLSILIKEANMKAFETGSIPLKYKYIIALTLDASKGAVDGVKNLTQMAIDEGATKEEIFESLRIAYFITGVGSIFTAANALKEIFDE